MSDVPLYASEAQISRLILGPGRLNEWHPRAEILERQGFPKIDQLMGGRYMPAVRAWLDEYNRVSKIEAPRPSPPENWGEPKPKPLKKPNNVVKLGPVD